MARRRTVDLLPEIFRTPTNKQFLSATLDQLVQEPNLKRTQGFVGRRVGPGVNPADSYVVEPTQIRADYQLEPGVVFFAPETDRAQDAITYPGMLDALDLLGADTQRQDRLWQSEYYAWDPFCDLDKFTNYSQYFWLPQGPDSVDVGSTIYPTTDAWEITRANGAYEFSDEAGRTGIEHHRPRRDGAGHRRRCDQGWRRHQHHLQRFCWHYHGCRCRWWCRRAVVDARAGG